MRRAAVVGAVLCGALLLLLMAVGLSRLSRSPQLLYSETTGDLYAYDVERGMAAAVVRGLNDIPVAWSWSPDGGQLAYVLLDSAGGAYDIYVWTPRLRRTVEIASNLPYGSPPQWSPDGRVIAAIDRRQDICLYTLDGRAPACLNVQPAGQPGWSPDGRALVFLSRMPQGGIQRVERESGDVTPLFAGVNGVNHPRWSPDGALIAFSYQEAQSFQRHLYVVPAGGGAARALTDGHDSYDQPTWSPDGAHIAFNVYPNAVRSQPDVAAVEVATGRMIDVASFQPTETDPRWSPDGRWLAFVSNRAVSPELLLYSTDEGLETGSRMPAAGIRMRLYAYGWRP